MRKLLLLSLLPILSFAQTQIGNDIDGEAIGDASGRTLSLSANGNVIAIGAFYKDRFSSSKIFINKHPTLHKHWSRRSN
jgi:hypothetical protein